MMVLLKNDCNFSGGNTQTLLTVLKNLNFMHSQVVGCKNLGHFPLCPGASPSASARAH